MDANIYSELKFGLRLRRKEVEQSLNDFEQSDYSDKHRYIQHCKDSLKDIESAFEWLESYVEKEWRK